MKATKTMRFPVVSQLEEYWEELRGNRSVPARSEVDPRRIETALEYAFILERIAPGVARFRLAGMHLNDVMGMEVRGMPLTSLFVPEARKAVSDTLEGVFAEPHCATLTLAGERGMGKPPLDGQLLLLPLKSDFGDITRVLGCLVTMGPIGRVPRRFELREKKITTIRNVRPTVQDMPPDVCTSPIPQAQATERCSTDADKMQEFRKQIAAQRARTQMKADSQSQSQPEPRRRSRPRPLGFAETAEDFAPQVPPRPDLRADGRPNLYVVKDID